MIMISMSSKLQHRFKMILLGEPGIGKTTLFRRIIYDTFERSHEPNSNDSTVDREASVTNTRYENRVKEVQLSENKKVNVCEA